MRSSGAHIVSVGKLGTKKVSGTSHGHAKNVGRRLRVHGMFCISREAATSNANREWAPPPAARTRMLHK
eukprot:7849893-Prorocentrum_lima.AAC.1